MNKAMSKVFFISIALFIALVVNLTWIMIVRAQWFEDRPENKRSIAKEMKIKRGDILGYDGSVIAGSERRSGYYYRDYPQGTLAPQLIGYDSALYGRSGIESELNDELTGQATDLGAQSWVVQAYPVEKISAHRCALVEGGVEDSGDLPPAFRRHRPLPSPSDLNSQARAACHSRSTVATDNPIA